MNSPRERAKVVKYGEATEQEREERLERAELSELIKHIGPARFVGRINSGVIDSTVGYEVLEMYIHHKEPSWLERLINYLCR